MNVTVEKLPKCLTEVSTVFPADEVSKEKSSILSSYSSQARIPGFRPGKAPRQVIEKRYGKEIDSELEYQMLNKVLSHVVKEEKISFLDISDRKLTHETDGSLKAVISLVISPEFELDNYKGIEVTVPDTQVTDEIVENELKMVCQQHAQYPTKEEGGVEAGDVAVISYLATIDGNPASIGIDEDISPYDEKEDYWIKAGEDNFLPGFSEQLIAMVVGSEKVIPHTFAEEFHIEALRGKTLEYTVTLKEVKAEELPTLAELAPKLLGEEGTEESFREQVREYLVQRTEKAAKDQKVDAILDKLAEGIEFDLPEKYLTAETQSQADHLVNQSMQYGMDEDSVVKMQDSIIESAEKNATKSLKSHFILQKIAELEELEVDQQEVTAKVYMNALQSGLDPQKEMNKLQKSGEDYQIKQSLLMDKVVDFLVENAKVTIETKSDHE